MYNDCDSLDREWAERVEIIDYDIFQSFSPSLIDQNLLKKLIEDLFPSQKRFFLRSFSFFFEDFYDDELLNFLNLLKTSSWSQIDWTENGQVIPLFPPPILAYCLPGIMHGIISDLFFSATIVAEALIINSLVPAIVRFDKSILDIDNFTTNQKRVILEFLLLLRDLMFTSDQRIRKAINECVLGMGVPVQAISPAPKTPDSGANSEEKSETTNVDTNDSVDKSNQEEQKVN